MTVVRTAYIISTLVNLGMSVYLLFLIRRAHKALDYARKVVRDAKKMVGDAQEVIDSFRPVAKGDEQTGPGMVN